MIQIAIVDDKYQNRASLSEKITFSNEVKVVLEAVNGNDFLEKMKSLPFPLLPHVVLMDIEMPVLDGIKTVERAVAMYPNVQFIMLTVFDDDDKLFQAIQAGACGYFLKDEKIANILEGIKQAQSREGAPMSPRIARKALQLLVHPPQKDHHPPVASDSGLSEREIEILKLLVEGKDYKQTAAHLYISPHTVRKHISNIYTKLHITSKIQLVNLAKGSNWV